MNTKRLTQLLAALCALVLLSPAPQASADLPAGPDGCGDLNGDEMITSVDALFVMQIFNGNAVPDTRQLRVGDVDRSGAIVASDALRLLQASAGISDVFLNCFQIDEVSSISGGSGCSITHADPPSTLWLLSALCLALALVRVRKR